MTIPTNEVLRRVEDLLEGDVVAHEGKKRRVVRIFPDAFNAIPDVAPRMCVVFHDSPLVDRRDPEDPRGPLQKATRFPYGHRLLLLESNCRAEPLS